MTEDAWRGDSIEIGAALPRASGVATMTIGMPYDATLVGQRFYVQACVVDAAANAVGLSWGNAGEAVVGER